MFQKPDIEDFLDTFKLQFAEENRHEINLSSSIRNLKEWSSLQTLIIVTAIDEKYGVILTEEDFRLSQSVKDLYERILMKLK